MFLDPAIIAIIIFICTMALAGIAKLLQRKFIDKEKTKAFQKKAKEDQKRFKELMKEAEKNKKEIDELQAQMLKEQMELMNKNMKLSLFTLPVFFVALFVLRFWFEAVPIHSFIPLPTFHGFFIFNPSSWIPTGITPPPYETGYYKAYFFYYLISTIILTVIEKVYDMFIKKKGVSKDASKAEIKAEQKTEIKAEVKTADEKKI